MTLFSKESERPSLHLVVVTMKPLCTMTANRLEKTNKRLFRCHISCRVKIKEEKDNMCKIFYSHPPANKSLFRCCMASYGVG